MKKPSMKAVAKAGGPAKTTAPKTVTKQTGSKASSNAVYPSGADEKRWKVESAMSTLMRADEIKKDASLMRDVKRMAKEQADKMSGLCGKAR